MSAMGSLCSHVSPHLQLCRNSRFKQNEKTCKKRSCAALECSFTIYYNAISPHMHYTIWCAFLVCTVHAWMCETYPSYSRRWLKIQRWGWCDWEWDQRRSWTGSRQRCGNSHWSSRDCDKKWAKAIKRHVNTVPQLKNTWDYKRFIGFTDNL